MSKASAIFLSAIVLLVVCALGAGLGIFYQTQQAPQFAQAGSSVQTMAATISKLSSGLVPSIVAYGQVTNINGQNLTLSFANQSMTIGMAQNVPVYSFTPSTSSTALKSNVVSAQKAITLSDIKKGDYANVTIKILPNGQMEGQTIIVTQK